MLKMLGNYNPYRFWSVFLIFLSLIVAGLIVPDLLTSVFFSIRDFTIAYFGWAIISEYFLMIILACCILMSPWGKLKLGKETDQPEFSFFSWVAMMYCCCLGIGVMFYAVAEPMFHLFQAPHVVAQGMEKKMVIRIN